MISDINRKEEKRKIEKKRQREGETFKMLQKKGVRRTDF